MGLTKGVQQLIDEANAQIETITVQDALTSLGREDTLFVDLRDIRELWREGTIPDALHAPRGMLEFWVDPQCPYHKPVLASDKRLLLFCASGWRSALATKALVDMGMQNVAHVGGGFTAWTKAGGPVLQVIQKSRSRAG